jgi:hypothetical protein
LKQHAGDQGLNQRVLSSDPSTSVYENPPVKGSLPAL